MPLPLQSTAAARPGPPAPRMQPMPVATDMADYYKRRAAYYERVYHKPERQGDLREIEAWVRRAFAGRRVLEVACGTGWWTPHGAHDAIDWLATDLSPETLAVARAKAMPPCVRFATADAYTLTPLDGGPFDAAFAGCWWSHVPLQRLGDWVATLHARLGPGAHVVVLDNSFVQTSSTPITRHDEAGNGYQLRTLDDGSVHEVLKNFPTPDGLRALLGAQARDVEWTAWTHYWAASWTVAG